LLLRDKRTAFRYRRKFDVNTVEIGLIETKDPRFRKMTKEEVASFVEQFEQ